MEFLIDYYRKSLINKINKAAKEANKEVSLNENAKVEEILSNMQFLAKKSDGPDEDVYWIPLEYKRLLFFILYGDKGRIHTEITQYTPGEGCEATCTIFIRENDQEKVLTDAIRYKAFADVDPFMDIPASKRNNTMREFAMSTAERTALFKAGICMDFTGDLDDDNMPKKDTSETLTEEQIAAMNNVAATLQEEAKANDVSSATDTTPTAPSEPKEEKSNIDLDKVLFGKEEGKDLSSMTSKYIAWMLNQIDIGKQKVDDKYRAKISELVLADSKAKSIYDKAMEEFNKSA